MPGDMEISPDWQGLEYLEDIFRLLISIYKKCKIYPETVNYSLILPDIAVKIILNMFIFAAIYSYVFQ